MENKRIESIIDNTMRNLQGLIETNTIIGEPILSPNGVVIIPISKVSVGYVVGGGEYADITKMKKIEEFPLAGGSGGGVTISPIGFIVETDKEVQFVDTQNKDTYQTFLNLFNKIIDSVFKEQEKNEK